MAKEYLHEGRYREGDKLLIESQGSYYVVETLYISPEKNYLFKFIPTLTYPMKSRPDYFVYYNGYNGSAIDLPINVAEKFRLQDLFFWSNWDGLWMRYLVERIEESVLDELERVVLAIHLRSELQR